MYTKEFNCLFASCTCSTRGTNDNNYVFYNTNYKKFRNKFYVYRIIFYYLYVIAVCFAKMASSDVYMKLGVRTCITVTFLTTALYCVLVPQCSSVYMIFVLQILPGMAT